MKKRQSPTPLQLQLWKVLDELTAKNLRPPTIRELMLEIGVNSTSTVMHRLNRGVVAGRVSKFDKGDGTHMYVPAWWDRMITENVPVYFGGRNA